MLYNSFIKKLTLKKILNLFVVFLSYIASIIIKRPIRKGMPISISIEPTNVCTLKCPQCIVGLGKLTRPKGFIEIQLYRKIIEQIKNSTLNLFLYFQGEPFLHSKITELIQIASDQNIFVGLSTNAQHINSKIAFDIVKSNLDYIIISLDGVEQSSYSFYRRGGEIDKVFNAIKALKWAKKQLNSQKPYIIVQSLVTSKNENELKSIKKLAKQLGADKVEFKSMQIIDFAKADKYLPSNKKFSRYIKINGVYKLKRRINNKCWRLWNSSVITWNGEVLPCCYDKNAKYSFGNVNNKKLKSLIHNSKFKKFAHKVLTNQKSIDICTNCWK